MRTLLDVRDVHKSFPDGTAAVAGITLSVRAGEIVAVVGPSGCGKTTLLQLAGGLQQPTAGSADLSTDQVGYVFQDPTLLPWRTVRRNVELFGELDGVGKVERRRRANHLIETVGLGEFAGHRPRELSGGMRMRVALARALLVEPDLFLFDEPFAALDEITRQGLGDELLRLHGERRFGALFVTHSVSEAVYLATRVLVLSPRPGVVLTEIEVPLGYPRSRRDPEFTQLVGQVSEALTEGLAR